MNQPTTTSDRTPAANAVYRPSRWKSRVLIAAMTMAAVLCGGVASSSATQQSFTGRVPVQEGDPASSRSTAPASAPASSPDLAAMEGSYASREASAKNLENFRGGDVVIVGTTGLIIVLLILLIILTV